MADIREKFNITLESECWDEAYEQALNDKGIPEWLTEKFLRDLNEETGLLPDVLENLVTALPYVLENPDLVLLAKTVYYIFEKRLPASKAISKYEQIVAPEGIENPIGYDLFMAFPIIAHLSITWKELIARGVDADVVKKSLMFTNDVLKDIERIEGKPTTSAYMIGYHRLCFYIDQFFIGRLRFELHPDSSRRARVFQNSEGKLVALMCDCVLHKSGYILGSGNCTDEEGSYPADYVETETTYEGYAVSDETHVAENARTVLNKSEWTPVFVPGDTVLKVHISSGPGFTKENCDEAFARAREILARCYPEYDFKGFVTSCWMLSPVLREILKPESNIISFQDRFKVFPGENNGLDVYQYVYKLHPKTVDEVDFKNLPEENTMQRGVKQKCLEGKFVQQCNGFIPFKA